MKKLCNCLLSAIISHHMNEKSALIPILHNFYIFMRTFALFFAKISYILLEVICMTAALYAYILA